MHSGQTGSWATWDTPAARPGGPPRLCPTARRGVRRVSLGIDVRYDTRLVGVYLPLNRLVYGPGAIGTSIPDLTGVELRMHRV